MVRSGVTDGLVSLIVAFGRSMWFKVFPYPRLERNSCSGAEISPGQEGVFREMVVQVGEARDGSGDSTNDSSY